MKKSNERIPWDDLIFKDRNKAYGAYELRKKYLYRLTLGLISSIVFVFSIVLYFYIDSKNNQVDEYRELFENLSTPVDMNDLALLIQESKPLKKPEKKKIEENKITITDSLSLDSLTEKKNDIDDAEIKRLDSLRRDSAAFAEKNKKENAESDSLYLVYDLPKFPGGPTAFNAYINRRIQMIAEIKKNNIHGMVQICFSIDEFGYPINIYVKDSINPSIDSAVCQIFKTMPRWIPSGKYNKNLKVIFDVPILL